MHAYKDLQFKHGLLETQCRRYARIEIPSLQKALETVNQDVQESQQALHQSNEKVQQLEQNLNESYDKCQSLAAKIELQADVDTEKLEKDIEARLQADFDAKYKEMHAAFKEKLESLKGSYKERIVRLKESHAEELNLVKKTILELREGLKRAMTMKKAEQKTEPAPASPPPSAVKKTRTTSVKPSRKNTVSVIDDDNDDEDDFVLPVKKPSRFTDASSITKVDDSTDTQDRAATSSKKTKPKKDDDLNDAAAYITDLDGDENNDQPKSVPSKSRHASHKETTAQEAKGKKAASKASASGSATAQKPSEEDNDFASPVLPFASLESDTQPTRESTPLLPHLEDEDEDAVSLVQPIRPKRRIRKLGNPIPVGSPESADTSHMISRLEDANAEAGYALQPIQKQAKTSMKKQNSNVSEASTSTSKRKAPSPSKAKKKQRTAK
ncbi:hypothetical protein MBANPS3_008307 [Mucor bainieri]